MSLLNRFPQKEQIVSVYAVGVTILYSWAIFNTIESFTVNWFLYFNGSDILVLVSYILAGSFLESIFLIGILLFISFILPTKILTDRFALRGTILTITFLGSIMFLYTKTSAFGILENITLWGLFFITTTLVFIFLGERFYIVHKIVEAMADRCTIFLYIYLPISFLSMFIILIRNLS
jgi:hypothetical protein